jgi:hypothetical protein
MSKDIHFSFSDLPKQFSQLTRRAMPYVPIIFFVVVALVYGFVLLRITMLSNAQPTDSDVSAKVAELTPHIDKSAAAQRQTLEDNNVNVQTLFNNARGNPFGE